MSKQVLIITPPFRPNIGGVETHLDDLIKEGVNKQFEFSVITYQPLVTKAKGDYFEKSKGYSVLRIPWPRFNLFLRLEKYPLLEFLYLFPGLFVASLFNLALNPKQKVIHAQGMVAATIAVFLGKLFNKKIIISTHSIYNFPPKGIYSSFAKFILTKADKILVLSKQSKEEIHKLGIENSLISIFTYWVDQNIFKPSQKYKARKRLKLKNDHFICLYVGRLVEVKGINELLSAAAVTPNVRFVILGDGPLSNKVHQAAKQHKNIVFNGKVENEKLPLYLNAADVLLVPSTHEEGFGRVILEALSCGLPVVAANRGAIPEALPDNAGVLIEISSENIKNTLINLRQNRNKLSFMSKHAIRFAKQRYNKKNSKDIFKFYG